MASGTLKGFIEIASGITSHAFNADGSALALAPNNNELHILHCEKGTFVERHVYPKGHAQVITAIDWAPESNQIVTCSQDRLALVWFCKDDEWQPQMVNLKDFDRAATCVQWSPCGKKFACGSAKQFQLCSFDEGVDFWVGKKVHEGIDSTINAVAFHPTSYLVAAGGCDKCVTVHSAVMKQVDDKAAVMAFFGGEKPPKTGERLFRFEMAGWINCLAFSPSGNLLAAAAHDSTVKFASVGNNPVALGEEKLLKLKGLPLNSMEFIDDSTLIGGGHDMVPIKLTAAGGGWECMGSLDVVKEKKELSGAAAVRAKMQQQADHGGKEAHHHKTTHENRITSVRVKKGSEDFTTAGMDGRICFWNASGIEGSFKGLKLR